MISPQSSVSVKDIFSYIPESRLDFFSTQTGVDWNVKKLAGKELFKLCLFGILSESRSSYRVFESFYQNQFFCQYANIAKGKTVSHSSIAERVIKIDVSYFKALYEESVRVYGPKIGTSDKQNICKYDSTITSLSSKLLSFGMENGQKKKDGQQGKKSIKFTIGYDNLPFNVNFHQEQAYINENLALGDILQSHAVGKKDIAVFDRGLNDRQRMQKLSATERFFVTRLQANTKYELVENTQVKDLTYETDSIQLISQKQVYLFSGYRNKRINTPFCLIEGILKETNEVILFLSNLPTDEFSAEQIAQIYKNRWEIEQFFRFIKQELCFKHYFSRNWNGIQVITYIILIAAILILVYKKLNNLKGYKIVKINFVNELQSNILENIVIYCGGDPSKLNNFGNFKSFESS